MPSPILPLRPVTPAPSADRQAPDAASSTRSQAPKRPPPTDTADSAKRPRTDASDAVAERDEAGWHSRAWRAYARRAGVSDHPAFVAWGIPVDD